MSKFKSDRATSNRSGNLLLPAVAPAALMIPLIASMPALADGRTAADFAVTTCRSIVDDPAKADAMAREQNWTVVAVPQDMVEAKGLKSVSAWTTDRGGDKFAITTGTGSPPDGATGDINTCTIVFRGITLPRDVFFSVLSAAALDLEPQTNMTFPQVNMEAFKIKTSGPPIHLLQLTTSLDNGNVLAMQMISVPQPDAP